MDLAQLGAFVVAVVGLGGLVFTALRYRREDAGAVVSQMKEVLVGMRELHDATSKALETCKTERLKAEGLARENEERWREAEKDLERANRKIKKLMEELDDA